MKIELCSKEDIKTIVDGLNSFNLSKVKALANVWTPLDFVFKTSEDIVVGRVLSGINYWNGFEIKILWVNESYRGKGIGQKLLQHIEAASKKKGAYVSMVDTFDFQAEAFYLKNDYKVAGEINNFPLGHRRIYFSKVL